MVLGITGGIGSGKTTIVKMFAEFDNVAIYLADDEAKKIMNTSLLIRKRLIEVFTEEVFTTEGLNRSFLASIVFEDKDKLRLLNEIVHPVVHEHFANFIKQHSNTKHYIVYENAILFENGSNMLCDKIITVTAPLDIKIERVISRDKTTKEAVLNRIKNQWPDAKKILQSHYLIDNKLLSKSKAQVLSIHNKLTKR